MALKRREANYAPEKKVKKGTLIRIIKYVLKHKLRLFFITIGMIGATLINVGASLFIKVAIDDYITPMLLQDKMNVDFGPYLRIILLFALFLLFGVACSIMYRLLMVKLSNGILREIREQMYEKMQKLPLRFFDTNTAGDIMSRYTNDLDTLRQVLSEVFPQSITGFLTVVAIFTSMLMLSVNLFVVVIIMLLVMLIFTQWAGRRSLKSYRKTQSSIGGLNAYVEEMVLGAKEVKVYCYEERNMKAFEGKNNEWAKAVVKADTLSNMLFPVSNALGNILYVLIAFVGGTMMLNGTPNLTVRGVGVLTIGTITSFMTFTKTFSSMIAGFSAQMPFFVQSLSGAERIFDLIDVETEIDEGTYKLEKRQVKIHGNGIMEKIKFLL